MLTRSDVVNFAVKVKPQRAKITTKQARSNSRQWQSVMAEHEALLKASAHKNLADVIDAGFEDLHGRVTAEIRLAAHRLNAGDLSPDDFEKAVRATLKSSYDKAAMLGKAKARGTVADLSKADLRAVTKHRYEDNKFLKGFIDDIKGKYATLTSEQMAERIDWRSQMYADALTGEMNASFVAHLPEDQEVRWVLGVAENCDDCIAQANKGVQKRSELTTVPGAGGTACLSNCQCELEVQLTRDVTRVTQNGVRVIPVSLPLSGAPQLAARVLPPMDIVN